MSCCCKLSVSYAHLGAHMYVCIYLALVCTVRIYVELTTFLAFIAISYRTFSAHMLSWSHAAAYSKLFARLCSDKICQLVHDSACEYAHIYH